jgi:hypothetical protein
MERPKDQCPARLHATGEPLPPDKEEDGYARGHLFFVFLFHFSHFHPFTAIVTEALPLEVIKGEAGATFKGRQNDQETIARTHLNRNHTSPPLLIRDLGSAPSLESL